MKKLIHAFLKVGFIFSIVIVALGVLFIPLAFVDGFKVATLVWGIVFTLFGIANLVGMIIIRKRWDEVKTKEEAKPLAIWSIVLGALFTTFPVVAGIMMLVLPEEEYGKKE